MATDAEDIGYVDGREAEADRAFARPAAGEESDLPQDFWTAHPGNQEQARGRRPRRGRGRGGRGRAPRPPQQGEQQDRPRAARLGGFGQRPTNGSGEVGHSSEWDLTSEALGTDDGDTWPSGGGEDDEEQKESGSDLEASADFPMNRRSRLSAKPKAKNTAAKHAAAKNKKKKQDRTVFDDMKRANQKYLATVHEHNAATAAGYPPGPYPGVRWRGGAPPAPELRTTFIDGKDH